MSSYIECDVCGRKMQRGFGPEHRRSCRVDLDYGVKLDLCPGCCRELQEWLGARRDEKLKDLLTMTAVTTGR